MKLRMRVRAPLTPAPTKRGWKIWGVGSESRPAKQINLRLEDSQRVSGFQFQGFGSRVQSSGFRVPGPGFRIPSSGLRDPGSGFRVPAFGFRVSDPKYQVPGSGLWVPGTRFRVSDSKFRVPKSRFRIPNSGIRVSGSGFSCFGYLEGEEARVLPQILHLISYEKRIKSNLAGNEVYYTACSLLVILKNLTCKLHCQKGFNLIPFSHTIPGRNTRTRHMSATALERK